MPLSTGSRPITPSQQAFIANLAAERRAELLTLPIRRAATGALAASEASALIDTLMALPRRAAERRDDSEPIPAPSLDRRPGRMLLAGGITATVTLPNGEHVTVEVGTRRPTGRGGWTNAAPTDEGARTTIRILGRRVGWINVVDGEWRVTIRTRGASADAIRMVLLYAAGASLIDGFRVQVADRCGRCRRELTDPLSIDRGIGPECFGRTTGSRHAALGVPSDATEATREAVEIVADALMTPAPAVEPIAERSLSDLAASITRPVTRPALPAPNSASVARARDLIAEALDAAMSDADRDYAMTIFDQLAAR